MKIIQVMMLLLAVMFTAVAIFAYAEFGFWTYKTYTLVFSAFVTGLVAICMDKRVMDIICKEE